MNDRRGRLGAALLWLFVLFPAIFCVRLMRINWVDQRFLDDWAWTIDWIKLVKGELTLHQIFAVHLEHRPALGKFFALASTWLAGGNVVSQCLVTYFWLLASFCCLVWLWLKRGGLTIRDAWLPLFLAAAVLFSPVQWQTLLWPICCGTVMPMLYLFLALCAAEMDRPWWVRCLAGTACAAAAMLSFASGTLVWLLPVPVMLWCGKFSSNMQRVRFVALWGLMGVLFTAFYMGVLYFGPRGADEGGVNLAGLIGIHCENGWPHTNFINEALPQFAYGHGKEDTMQSSAVYFFEHPALDFQFVAVFTGCYFVKGWAANTQTAALIVACVMFAALAAAMVYCALHWKDKELRARLLPMFSIALYTPLTGLMVAVGRLYAGVGVATNIRYLVHQTEIIIGLIGAGFFIARHWAARASEESRRTGAVVGWSTCGVLIGVIGVGWIYGSSMMSEWQWARLKDHTAQRLSLVFPLRNNYVGHIAGHWQTAVDGVRELDGLNQLHPAPIKDRRLSNFKFAEHPLGIRHSQMDQLYKDARGDWHASGWSDLPGSGRPADAVLFTYRKEGETEWTIFGFTMVYGVPNFLTHSMGKDLWAIRPAREAWPSEFISPWSEDVAVAEEPPPGARITAWAMDAKHFVVYRISRGWSTDPKAGAEGELLENLAQPIPMPDSLKK